MVSAKFKGVILEKTELEFEHKGVMNPAIAKEGNTVHMFYRAEDSLNKSTIGYCKLQGPLTIIERSTKPVLISSGESETEGMEDPRIVKIEETYYLTYSAYDLVNSFGALAISQDLKKFDKQGIIVPRFTYQKFESLLKKDNNINPIYFHHNEKYKANVAGDRKLVWDKDVMFFPKRINGKLAFLHRIMPAIQIVYADTINDLTEQFWENYFSHFNQFIVLEPKYPHEASHIGGGCPPIETKEGWLLIYHGVEDTGNELVYHACAALLDPGDPTKVIGELNRPLFSPGHVKNNIPGEYIFPTGTSLFDDDLYVYYGRDDFCIGVFVVKLSELLVELKNNLVVRSKKSSHFKSQ